MMIWAMRKDLGLLPQFFSSSDPRPARDQLHEAYAHGGGVLPFDGFEGRFDFEDPFNSHIDYPDDPPLFPVGWTLLREELILVFPYAWVAIVQPNGEFIVTRCD